MHLKEDFSSGAPISQVPASWFNAVAKFVNNLVPGKNISFVKHDDGSATMISAELDTTTPSSSTDISGKMTDTYVEEDTPPVHGDPVWSAGGANGYIEDAIVATNCYNSIGNIHRLWHVKKHYSADGRLLRVDKMNASDYVKV